MVSINNSKDLIANSLQLVGDDGELKDIKEVIATAAAIIEGDLSPEQIQTISNLSSALNNDPDFFTNNQLQINSKAVKADVYTKSETDNKINDLINDAPDTLNTLNKLASALGDDDNFSETVINQLATKAPLANPAFTGTVSGISKSMIGLGNVDNTSDINKPISSATKTYIDNSLTSKSDIFITNSPLIKNTNPETNNIELNLSQTFIDDINSRINLKANSTDVTSEISTQLATIVDSAPDSLNTLKELADALGNDANYATVIQNQLATKANQSTTYTKTETDTLLTLKANQETTYTKTELSNTAVAWSSGTNTTTFHILETGTEGLVIRTPSGASSANFLGNVGGAAYDGKVLFYKDVEILGNFINTGLTNQLSSKANLSTTYTKIETDTLINGKEDVLIAGSPSNGFPILTDKRIRGLVANSPLSLVNDGSTSLTINADVFSKSEITSLLLGKQMMLSINKPPDGFSLITEQFVKGLKAAAPITITEVNQVLTIGLDGTNNFDSSTVYTKTETDTLLNLKVDMFSTELPLSFVNSNPATPPKLKVDCYAKADTYTKTQVDNYLSNKQDSLAFNIPVSGSSLGAGKIIKGLKVTTPITLADASNILTVGLDKLALADDFEPKFEVEAPLEKGFDLQSGILTLRINPILLSPYWVAGRVYNTTIYKSSGRHNFTITKLGTGLYQINYAVPHPDGSNVIALAMGEGLTGSAWNVVNNANSGVYANTASSTTFVWRDNSLTALDATFSFVVLA